MFGDEKAPLNQRDSEASLVWYAVKTLTINLVLHTISANGKCSSERKAYRRKVNLPDKTA